MKTKVIIPQLGSEIEVEANDAEGLKKTSEKHVGNPNPSTVFILQSDGKEIEKTLPELGAPFHLYVESINVSKIQSTPQHIDGNTTDFSSLELVKIYALENASDKTQQLDQAKLVLKTLTSIFNISQQRYLEISLTEYSLKMKKNGLSLLNTHLNHLLVDFKSNLDILRRDTIEYEKFMDLIKIEKSRELLQSTKLLPSLVVGSKQYLVDLVQESSINVDYEACKKYLLPLQRQAKSFSEEISKKELELKQISIEIEPHLRQPVEMENILQTAASNLEAQKILLENVSFLVEKMIGGDISTNHFIQIFNMDPINKATKSDEYLRTLLIKAQEINSKFSEETLKSFESLISHRTKIKSHVSKIQLYNNLYSESIEKPLTALRTVHYLPEQYGKSLVEIERRKVLKIEVEKHIENMNSVLKNIAEEENLIRKNFVDATRYVPRDLIPGLNEKFPHLSVQVIPFDTKLPEIPKDELEEGEWQHIKEEAEDKVAIFGKINLSDSQYFKRDFAPAPQDALDQSLTSLAKDLFKTTTNTSDKVGPVNLVAPKSELELCKEKIALMEKEMAEKNDLITQLSTDRVQLVASLDEKKHELEQIAKAKEEEIARAQSKLENESSNTAKKQKEVEEALQVVNEFKSIQNKLNLEISNLKTENSKLNLNFTTVSKKEAILTDTIKKLEADFNIVKKNQEISVSQLNQEKNTVKNLNMENTALKQVSSETEIKSKKLTDEVNKLKTELISTIKASKDKDVSINSLQEAANQANVKIQKLATEVEVANKKIQDLTSEVYLHKEREKQFTNNIHVLTKASDGAKYLQDALDKEQTRTKETLEVLNRMHVEEINKIKKIHQQDISEINDQIPNLLNQINQLKEEKEIIMRKQSSRLSSTDYNDKINQLNEIITKSTGLISHKSLEIQKMNNTFGKVEKTFLESKDLMSHLDINYNDLVREFVNSSELSTTVMILSKQMFHIKNFLEVFINIMDPLNGIPQLKNSLFILKDKVIALEKLSSQLENVAKKLNAHDSIAVSNFLPGDRVLFVKKDKLWECFNIGAPGYFLDEDSIGAIQSKFGYNTTQAIGTILYTQQLNTDKDRTNPLRLKESYHYVTISI